MDKRKYITETDILEKNSRIDIILDTLELIMDKDIALAKAINIVSNSWNLEEEKVIRLMPDIIIERIETGAVD